MQGLRTPHSHNVRMRMCEGQTARRPPCRVVPLFLNTLQTRLTPKFKGGRNPAFQVAYMVSVPLLPMYPYTTFCIYQTKHICFVGDTQQTSWMRYCLQLAASTVQLINALNILFDQPTLYEKRVSLKWKREETNYKRNVSLKYDPPTIVLKAKHSLGMSWQTPAVLPLA